MNIVTRAQWGARPPTATTPLANKYGFACHWEGPHLGLASPAQAQATVRQIQADHMEGRNSDHKPWVDIAYSWLTDPWGNVYEGRGWDNRSAANGSTAANASWGAICYLGGEGDAFTSAAKQAIVDLIALGRSQHGYGSDAFPHSHFFSTQCPGDDVRSWLAAGMPTSSTPQPSGDDDMIQYEWPDGAVVCVDAAGEAFCPVYEGRPTAKHYGGMPDLRPDAKQTFTKTTSIVGIDRNNSQAGYIIKSEDWKSSWKFDANVSQFFGK